MNNTKVIDFVWSATFTLDICFAKRKLSPETAIIPFSIPYIAFIFVHLL